MGIDRKLLDILACPLCKGSLRQAKQNLCCPRCRLAYPVRDDIPILLEEEARSWEPEA